jgi:hypothetical protein
MNGASLSCVIWNKGRQGRTRNRPRTGKKSLRICAWFLLSSVLTRQHSDSLQQLLVALELRL